MCLTCLAADKEIEVLAWVAIILTGTTLGALIESNRAQTRWKELVYKLIGELFRGATSAWRSITPLSGVSTAETDLFAWEKL
jgi:hypothetical protein